MKLLTEEQLCELPFTQLTVIRHSVKINRVQAARKNQWKRHQELGEYIHKIEQLIKEHTLSDQ